MVHLKKRKYFSLAEKFRTVEMIQNGISVDRLAKIMDRSPITLMSWERMFRRKGIVTFRDSYKKTLRADHATKIEEYLKRHPLASYSELSRMLNGEVCIGSIRYYCVKHGLKEPFKSSKLQKFSDTFKLGVIILLMEGENINTLAKEIHRSPITIRCWERWFRKKGCLKGSEYAAKK